ncbi:MAG: ATP-dependent zinc metalloprotease FtsH [Porphyromonas sp.]|uniref:ATP-dependent zinc metalloprotease FtsH n=1 Tax=Porphyromonas sp. TaxID=1924944 RepID=UPI002A752EE8|nr:ATP-dependent zinc metalloprotease FtsH [Porphyromonas sp.]MDY3111231.1 ATP-dependent zinc metalloprotease FtsH [Porphyromonas sp.]
MNKHIKNPLGTPTPNPQGSDPRRGKRRFNPMWLYLSTIFILAILFFLPSEQPTNNKEVDWTEFQQLLRKEVATKVEVNRTKGVAVATLNPKKVSMVYSEQELQNLEQRGFPFRITKVQYQVKCMPPSVDRFDEFIERENIAIDVKYKTDSMNFWLMLANWLPLILVVVFWIWIFRRMSAGPGGKNGGPGGVFNVGKSKAKLYDKKESHVTFDDVAGLHEAKQELQEIVEFLKNPDKYTKLGGKIPKGALLVGPPGTGKTLFAKAVAGEAHVPFFSISGSDFVEMFVGVGASRVRDLFKQAKEKSPCIIFIDEIDAVGRARSKNAGFSSNDERENTLNQLLTEMDGFDGNSGVIILAATNRVDILDKALLRAGRFDRQIYVDLPDLNDRKEIFLVHMKGLKLGADVDVDQLSRQTPGFSGADIANVCNEAALIAARHDKQAIEKQDFMDAVDRIIGGLEKKNKIITEDERRSIAIHEAGHATISWMTEYGNPLVKVTIVPRGKALGAAWYMPEERQITHTQVLLDELCSLLGGRAAEELFLNRISTGAANDLERVTKIAYAMITYYGMSDKLPNLNYADSQSDGYTFQKPYSEETAVIIDQEVSKLIATQYARAKEILTQYAEQHHQLAQLLLEREVIYTEDVETILGKRQWVSRSDELDALNEAARAKRLASATPPPYIKKEEDEPTPTSSEEKEEEDQPTPAPSEEKNDEEPTDHE